MRRTIFYVSDGTGITAETIGHSVLTQFDGVDFETFRIPFVDDETKARTAALRIKTVYATSGVGRSWSTRSWTSGSATSSPRAAP